MKSREIEWAAWKRFEEWCERYRKKHPETEDLYNYVSDYDLAMIYGKEGEDELP